MIEISFGGEEIYKIFKDVIPPSMIPSGYNLADIRLDPNKRLILVFEKKNGGHKNGD